MHRFGFHSASCQHPAAVTAAAAADFTFHDSLLLRPPQDVMGPWFRGRVLNKDAMEAAMGQVGG